jgi:hypothetical protein
MVTRVLGNGTVILLRSQKSLLRDVPLTSGADFERRTRLYVAIPVGFFSSAGEDYAFSSSRVVEDDLQDRLPWEPALASLMGQHEEPVAEQPAEVEMV